MTFGEDKKSDRLRAEHENQPFMAATRASRNWHHFTSIPLPRRSRKMLHEQISRNCYGDTKKCGSSHIYRNLQQKVLLVGWAFRVMPRQ